MNDDIKKVLGMSGGSNRNRVGQTLCKGHTGQTAEVNDALSLRRIATSEDRETVSLQSVRFKI